MFNFETRATTAPNILVHGIQHEFEVDRMHGLSSVVVDWSLCSNSSTTLE